MIVACGEVGKVLPVRVIVAAGGVGGVLPVGLFFLRKVRGFVEGLGVGGVFPRSPWNVVGAAVFFND